MTLIHIPKKGCPLCIARDKTADADEAIFYRKVDFAIIQKKLAIAGFVCTENEIKQHAEHFAKGNIINNTDLLAIDKGMANDLESLDSEKVIDAKIKKIRIIMNNMEQANMTYEPEYLSWHKELNSTISLKEQLSGKLKTTSDVNIDMSVFKKKIEEGRKKALK